MAARILVVDRNEAFATMLEEMLEMDGGYNVKVVRAGSDALNLLRQTNFDLTIVDMDLDARDMGYRDLAQSVRGIRPTMRLMLIPFMGEQLPAEALALDIQGTLSKPFFVDDLLPSIQEALTKKVRPAPASPPPPMPAPAPAPAPAPRPKARSEASLPSAAIVADVQAVLSELARETRADIVLLVSTAAGARRVVAQASTLSDDKVGTLADLCVTTVQAAQATARSLDQPDVPFEHNMFEGESLRLYIMALSSELFLVVVVPMSTPLGTIRHNLRRADRDLARLALT
jgi:CheY-like chemotaxis protein/predicted regulator of Ras-like GTPase activity (Roadblock/LC7/MglB family)